MCRRSLVLTLAFVFVNSLALLLPFGIGQEGPQPTVSDSAQEKPEQAGEDPQQSRETTMEFWECYVKWKCMDGTDVLDSGWVGPGHDMDKEMALEMAGIDCDGVSCMSGTLVCCKGEGISLDCPANDQPDCQLTEMIVKEVRFGGQSARIAVPKTDSYISRFSAVAENGKLIGASSKVYCTAEKAREAAWSEFAPRATQNDGLRPGTLVNRTVKAFFYRCRIRVRSEYEMTLYDQDVEATGKTPERAMEEAWQAAARLKKFLEKSGHLKVEIVPGVRCERILNTLPNVCKKTFSCRHECVAKDGWRIVVGRRASNRARACCEAAGAALVLADGHGGVNPLSCRTLPDGVNSKAAKSAGCSGCGN